MPQEPDDDLAGKLALAQRELSEALERQAATDEVLRVIKSSAGELEPGFPGNAGKRHPHLSGGIRLYVAW